MKGWRICCLFCEMIFTVIPLHSLRTDVMMGGEDDDPQRRLKENELRCQLLNPTINREEINAKRGVVKWQSIGGNGPNINHLLISGRSRESREIPQLVLHPSSVWIGRRLDAGNIRWLIFRTGWRVPSDVGWISPAFSETLRFTLQTWKQLRWSFRTQGNLDHRADIYHGVLLRSTVDVC